MSDAALSLCFGCCIEFVFLDQTCIVQEHLVFDSELPADSTVWQCLLTKNSLSPLSPPLSQSRLEAQHNESYVTVSTLQAEKQELIQIKESLFKYVRELEQINDDLERAKRYVHVCVYTGAHQQGPVRISKVSNELSTRNGDMIFSSKDECSHFGALWE